MALIKQLFVTLGLLLVIYSGVWGLTRLLLPVPEFVDTEESVNLLYEDEARTAIYARRALDGQKHNIVVLGSSNVREGLRPEEIHAIFPEYEIHQFSVHASNIRGMKEVLELIYETLPEERESIVFVLGASYFCYNVELLNEDHTYPHSLIQTEMLRFGIYREGQDKVISPLVPKGAVLTLIDALHPFMALYKAERKTTRALDYGAEEVIKVIAKRVTRRSEVINDVVVESRASASKLEEALELSAPKKLSRFERLKQADWSDRLSMVASWLNGRKFNRNEREVSADDKMMMLSLRNHSDASDYYGKDLQQFELLREITDLITGNNDKLVILDAPLPRWHAQQSLFNSQYIQIRDEFYPNLLTHPNVYYVNIEDLDSEEFFYDSSHPKPKYTHLWAERFGQALKDQEVLSLTDHSVSR